MMRLTSTTKHETCLNPAYPTRQWGCPHCGEKFEAARRAMTLKCPHCAKPIRFEDVVFNRSSSETLTTLGRVRITRRGSVQGVINCSELLIEGAMHGTAHVRGKAVVGAKAILSGTLHTQAIAVEAGGRIRGTLHIAPPSHRSSDITDE